MTICNVLHSMTIGANTAVIVDGAGELFRNGTGVLDENGKPYEVLSVGMEYFTEPKNMLDKTSLLIGGDFSSKRLWV